MLIANRPALPPDYYSRKKITVTLLNFVCNRAAARECRVRGAIFGKRATKNRRSEASAGEEFRHIAEMPMKCRLLRCRVARFVVTHMYAAHFRRAVIANAKASIRRNPHGEKNLHRRGAKGALAASAKRKTRESVPSDSPRRRANGVVADRTRPPFDHSAASLQVDARENLRLRSGLHEKCGAKSALALSCQASS